MVSIQANGLERFQMLTMKTTDGRTISGVYTREQAVTRAAWALLQPDYASHTLIDWHCAWCDPRDKKEPRSDRPLTSGVCKECAKSRSFKSEAA